MKLNRRSSLAVAFILAAAFILIPSASSQTNPATCEPKFPFVAPWLGGDAAYSIPLHDGRSVWIFGDTLTGNERYVEGKEPRMVRNSIGVSRCDKDGFKIDYVIRQDDKSSLKDFFPARLPKTWYWPLDGFEAKGELWVTLLCLRATPEGTPGFGFETCGSDLAQVSHLERDPQKWEVKVHPLVPDGAKAYPSATTVVEGKYVYLFALYETGTRPMIASRIPLAGLTAPAKNLEYLAQDGKWKKGFVPAKAKHVMETGNSEMTIRYHAGLKKWLAVMNHPTMFSDKIILRRADSLTGPWKQEEEIYTIPELQKTSPIYDPDTFCYAGKEHPEFRTDGTILITYACNTQKPEKLMKYKEIYFPQVVRIPLKSTK